MNAQTHPELLINEPTSGLTFNPAIPWTQRGAPTNMFMTVFIRAEKLRTIHGPGWAIMTSCACHTRHACSTNYYGAPQSCSKDV